MPFNPFSQIQPYGLSTASGGFVQRPETGELWACSLPEIDGQIKLSWIGKVPSYTTYGEYFKEDDAAGFRYMTDDEKNTLYKLHWYGQVL